MNQVEEFRDWAGGMAERARKHKAACLANAREQRDDIERGCGKILTGLTQRSAIWIRPNRETRYFGLRLYCDTCFNKIMEGGITDYARRWMPDDMICGQWADLARKDVFVRGESPADSGTER